MCSCNNILPQSKECFDQQIVVNIPEHMSDYADNRSISGCSRQICIDPCIVNEIKDLWNLGIITYGCCCGHNTHHSFVNVDDKDIDFMLSIGYIQQHVDLGRTDTFRLKSV